MAGYRDDQAGDDGKTRTRGRRAPPRPGKPAIGTVATQAEALEAITELDSSHFKNMMRSIKEHGLDPGNSFYVLQSEEEESAYVVVDGNRRLAALKVLNDPTILQGTTLGVNLIKQIAKVAEGFNAEATKILSAVLFDNRDDANEWILRRHGRSMDGEGRISWGPLEMLIIPFTHPAMMTR